MASGLTNQTLAANDGTFLTAVQDAMIQTAINVYSEANTLNTNIAQGVAITQIQLAVALGSGLGANTVLAFGGETVTVAAGGAASGAQTIPINSFTPTHAHFIGEPVSPPSVSNHVARAAFATKVLNNPSGFALLFSFACASQGVDKTSPDSTIVNTVSAVWNSLAGA